MLKIHLPFVDVRDVANIAIRSFDVREFREGRYLVVENSHWMEQYVKIIQKNF